MSDNHHGTVYGTVRILGAAAILAAAFVVGAYFIGTGVEHIRSYERFVTVKGLAERHVVADRAVWVIMFTATDDDLETAQRKIESDTAAVRRFVTGHGIPTSEIEVQKLDVIDQLAQPYHYGPIDSRFIIRQVLLIRTGNVDAVRLATQEIGDLIAAGVVLGGEGGYHGPSYRFTGLNEIKHEMIAEATAAARRSADQFAADSGSRIGSIRRANQGVFQILPADNAYNIDEASQINKTVRAVVTLEYFLED